MPWYEELFDEEYLSFYSVEVAPAVEDAAFVDRSLALAAGARLMDLGCGYGRHAVALAQLGHRVTGVDLSTSLLARAAALAHVVGARVAWERRDMRDLAGLGPFDACVCLYTVFGYFDDEENESVLRGVRDVLAPSGRLLLDVTNPIALLRVWPQEVWREILAGVTRETSRYDSMRARLVAERTVWRGGARLELPSSSVRMYAPHEMAALLDRAGFVVDQVYGALREVPLDGNRSPRQVWVATRA